MVCPPHFILIPPHTAAPDIEQQNTCVFSLPMGLYHSPKQKTTIIFQKQHIFYFGCCNVFCLAKRFLICFTNDGGCVTITKGPNDNIRIKSSVSSSLS